MKNHECHHFGDNSWKKVLDEMGGFKLGLTATPNRSDNVSLSSSFSKILYRYSIIDGIKEKWLADIKGITCKLDIELDKIKVSQGDFQTSSLTKISSWQAFIY